MSPGGEILACVLGDMDLVRALALAGVRSATVAGPRDPLRFSRHSVTSLDWIDHWNEQEALVDRLMSFARSQPAKPVLFYQSTGDMLTVSRYRERLREGFRFIMVDADLIDGLTDKASFHALAERLRLPVAPACRLRPAAGPDAREIDLRFPLILKPVTRQFERWSRVAPQAKAIRVDTASDLHALWPRLAAADTEVLAEEMILGPESSIESYHTYVDEAGVVAEFTGRKIRTRPAEFGYSTAVTITHAPDVAALGRQVMERLGLTGVAKLDFKRAPDGELLLLEVNPRFTLWHHPGAVAGVNIPASVFADLTGRDRPPVTQARAGVRWCDLWEDAAAARAVGELGPRWALSALTSQAKSNFAWDDPMPFVRAVAAPRVARHVRKRVARYRLAARRRLVKES